MNSIPALKSGLFFPLFKFFDGYASVLLLWVKGITVFNYNSRHKIITAFIIILWAVYNFTSRDTQTSYENGQNKVDGSKKNGENNGTWTWYYPNGSKQIQGSFVDGKREGIWTTWDENEHLIQQCEYHNDKLNGYLITYDIAGNEISRVHYENDVAD